MCDWMTGASELGVTRRAWRLRLGSEMALRAGASGGQEGRAIETRPQTSPVSPMPDALTIASSAFVRAPNKLSSSQLSAHTPCGSPTRPQPARACSGSRRPDATCEGFPVCTHHPPPLVPSHFPQAPLPAGRPLSSSSPNSTGATASRLVGVAPVRVPPPVRARFRTRAPVPAAARAAGVISSCPRFGLSFPGLPPPSQPSALGLKPLSVPARPQVPRSPASSAHISSLPKHKKTNHKHREPSALSSS